jgi:DNA-binding LacI/PurR family transcriptional regulator
VSQEPARGRAANIFDVARLAGVSHQTVSRVINASQQVRPETRDRVLAAMRMLDYRPNTMARALATGRSRTLGVVSFDTTLYGPASTLFSIHRAAHEGGYFISTVSLRTLDRESFLDAVERLRGQGVEGILVIAPQTDAAHSVLQLPDDLAVVAVEAGPERGVPVVAVDQVAGAAQATRHLLELGHRTVWHIAGPEDWLEAQQRIAGWRQVLQAAAADTPPIQIGDWSPRSGYEIGQRLALDPEVSAVFVGNDQMALGLLRAMHEAGRAVPGEVSVVGFDDVPEAAFFTPPLTTVRQDFIAVGRLCIELVLRRIAGDTSADVRSIVEPELIVRQSSERQGSASS